jgi:hypothetical protein
MPKEIQEGYQSTNASKKEVRTAWLKG